MSSYWLYHGDCVEVMKGWPENSVDAVVCDPPYDLTAAKRTSPPPEGAGPFSRHRMGVNGDHRPSGGFMNKSWDGTGIAFDPATWAEVMRVLKPGGHLLAFGGTRTYHRMVCAIEDAGFEIRDSAHWMYGSGMIKSRNVARDFDRMHCALPGRHYAENLPKGAKARPGDHRCPELPENAEQYGHIGTAIAPGHEPICLARKPMVGTVAENILQYGTGGLNVDGCALGTTDNLNGGAYSGGERPNSMMGCTGEAGGTGSMLEAGSKRLGPDDFEQPDGRRPKNVLLSHAEGCVRTGTRPVKQNGAIALGTNAAESDKSSRVALGDLGARGEWAAHPGEMEAWDCAAGCLVAELDQQAEGSSRYFKTFAPEAPFRYQAKPSRRERDFGCEHLPAKTAGEATGREGGSDGLKSPRAGAGRTGGRGGVRNVHPT